MARFYIVGNTYPVKDQIKALGCRFDGAQRQWYADEEAVALEAQALVPESVDRGRREYSPTHGMVTAYRNGCIVTDDGMQLWDND
jgi:hypothetical protein